MAEQVVSPSERSSRRRAAPCRMSSHRERRAGVGLRSERGPVLTVADAVHRAGRARRHDHRHRGAVDRRRPRRLHRSSRGCSRSTCWPRRSRCRSTASSPTCSAASRSCCSASALFLLGSVLCGVAWSMPALIAFRAVQGLGAGAIQPMTHDDRRRHLHRRRAGQGRRATSPACGPSSSVVGPTLGGVFSEYLCWRWIFFVNIPLCLLAACIARSATSRRQVERTPHRIDYARRRAAHRRLHPADPRRCSRAATPGPGPRRRARRARRPARSRWSRSCWWSAGPPEPVLPLLGVPPPAARRQRTWSRSASARSSSGLTSYVPTYAQGVLGTGPLVAGFALATLTIGWPIAAPQSGRLYLRIGLPRHRADRRRRRRRRHAPALLLGGHVSVLAVAARLLRRRRRPGPDREPDADRRAVERRLGRARRGDRRPTCSAGRSAARSGWPCSARSPTPPWAGAERSPAAGSPTATHDVFVAGTVLSVVLLIAVSLMPKQPPPPRDSAPRAEPAAEAPTAADS